HPPYHPGAYSGDHRLWRLHPRRHRTRQYRRHAIPSGKEPGGRSRFSPAFPSMAAVRRDGMILYPAIDLKDGRCVRLRQGDMAQATVFNDDAAGQARAFEDAGFEWLHVVDLNGAFEGRSINAPAIRAILAAIHLPMQLGGGIRDMAGIESWLDA